MKLKRLDCVKLFLCLIKVLSCKFNTFIKFDNIRFVWLLLVLCGLGTIFLQGCESHLCSIGEVRSDDVLSISIKNEYTTGNYPCIDIRQENGATKVYWEEYLILELRDDRRLRFRSTYQNDHWIGSERRPMDLCWAYSDEGVNDYVVENIVFKNLPVEQSFFIEVNALKPSIDGTAVARIDANWNSESQKFEYMLSLKLNCKLEQWYENSSIAKRAFNHNPKASPRIEGVDYHVEYMSLPDIVDSAEPEHHELYDWMVYKNKDKNWTLMPKIYLPYITRRAAYPAGKTGLMEQGSYFGFIDLEEGGWVSEAVEIPSRMNIAPCWMFFDVHVFFMEAIPPRYSSDDLDLSFKLHFEHINAEQSRTIAAEAEEIAWENLPEYHLPILKRNNDFREMITENGNASKYMWWASSFDCFRDDSVGFDDSYSVSIKHDVDKSDAWYGLCWGYPFETERVKGLYRIKARVKTENCTGIVRLAVAQTYADCWIHSKRFIRDSAVWEYSKDLSGTNDWTELNVIVNMTHTRRHIVLEHIGKGQSWFDNVEIEKIP
ncbi:MAG: hypothetical protein ACIAQZ_08835 [Sedimentisphaeraceae bacterium JB056]